MLVKSIHSPYTLIEIPAHSCSYQPIIWHLWHHYVIMLEWRKNLSYNGYWSRWAGFHKLPIIHAMFFKVYTDWVKNKNIWKGTESGLMFFPSWDAFLLSVVVKSDYLSSFILPGILNQSDIFFLWPLVNKAFPFTEVLLAHSFLHHSAVPTVLCENLKRSAISEILNQLTWYQQPCQVTEIFLHSDVWCYH